MIKKIRLLDIITGYRCNAKCIFCSIDNKMRSISMTTSTIKDIINQYTDKNNYIAEIRFGGGEPTIRKDILDLIAYAKNKDVKTISIQTNGYMFYNRNFLKECAFRGLNKVRLSFRTIDKDVYESLTQVKMGFHFAEKALDNLSDYKIETEIDLLIIKPVLKELNEILDFFTYKKIKKVNFWALWLYNISSHDLKWLAYRYSDAIKILKKAMLKHKNISYKLMYFPFCILTGEMRKYYWNPIEEEALVVTPGSRFYLDEEFFMRMGKINICAECPFNNKCTGISDDYVSIYGLEEFVGRPDE